MRLHKIATATMLVLAVSGGTAVGAGTALADTGPTHGKAKARAEGGSSTGGRVFQQDIAQSAQQNNNCNNLNTGVDNDVVTLTDARVTGRCVTTDGSLTAFSRIHNGPAEAQGGSSTAGLAQQNTAQRGRQNNNCHNPNDPDATVEEGGRVEGLCTDQDLSFSKHTWIHGSGARAEGGSNTSVGGNVYQQNIAQEGRQNNTCNNHNDDTNLRVTGGRETSRCGNLDRSFSKRTWVKGGGAQAEGGNATEGGLEQQNIAQEGRQNNVCANPNFPTTHLEPGHERSSCENKDASFSKHTWVKGRGAHAQGGNAVGGGVFQQNIAQEGRQNNTCYNPENSSIEVRGGGRETSRCGNKDASFSKRTWVKGGGARAEGGNATGGDVDQQNIAQEGRQNNNCANPNLPSTDLNDGSQETSGCGNRDASFSKHTWVKGGGARAEGGNATGGDVDQQNIAQEGRQNNNCSNSNENLGDLDVTGGGRVEGRCGNKDTSVSKHRWVKGGGARAEGGSATADVSQQNTAQEGRQNNNCNNRNSDADLTVTGGRLGARCGNMDFSFSHKTFIKGGGARAEGGGATGGAVNQQNAAQEGRQNNNCANPNFPEEIIDLTDSRSTVSCKTLDGSTNLHSAEIGGGAKTEGGSATGTLFQQNTAQEGRQNNNCDNPNNLTLTTTGSRTAAQCTAVDHSTNIATEYR
ncbi:hypothetical protein [Streptomyces sp. NPDC051776]|uniref:hypothetical protein n=1 Tax=Streptomyces sp. NPDC051776 TaxID=3155414 RepID=UPI0034431582